MKFFVDAPISFKVVEFLRDLGHEAFHAIELGMEQASDDDIAEYGAREGMVILTTDLGFSDLLVHRGEVSPGVMIIRLRYPTREKVIERLHQTLTSIPKEEFLGAITIIEENRVRVRRL